MREWLRTGFARAACALLSPAARPLNATLDPVTDQRIAIWNVLHDGEITVAAREGNMLVMLINIPYLRALLAPIGDSFALRLGGFRSAKLKGSDGRLVDLDLASLPTCHLEILSTESNSMPVEVEHTMGSLILDFDTLQICLDTGRAVDFSEVHGASVRYWSEFEAAATGSNKSLERTRGK